MPRNRVIFCQILPVYLEGNAHIYRLCMKVDLVSFECCGCGGLGIFLFNGVSHEGLVCY